MAGSCHEPASRSSREARAKAGWEAGIRTPITWSRERCTDSRPVTSVRFLSGFHLACFSLLRSVSLRSRANCLFVSHLSIDAAQHDICTLLPRRVETNHVRQSGSLGKGSETEGSGLLPEPVLRVSSCLCPRLVSPRVSDTFIRCSLTVGGARILTKS